jgi:hypothetical protein
MASQKGSDWVQLGRGDTYVDRVRKPLQCLIYMIPFLLVYQIGSAVRPAVMEYLHAGHSPGGRVDVVAFALLQKFFAMFGAAGNYLPLLTVVVILLSMHLAHKDKWEIDFKLYAGMFAESLVWAVPVLVIGIAVSRRTAPQQMAVGLQPGMQFDWWTECVLSIGAGVYEELLFRLIGITLLTIVCVDVMKMKVGAAIPVVILVTAVLFSGYHHWPGGEAFGMGVFFFRMCAGIYFAGLYIFRGFGIAVGAHAFYDLMVVGVNHHGQ